MNSLLLDTVTVSEIRRGTKADPSVWKWQSGIQSACLSVITLHEILYGIKALESRDGVFAARLAAWYATLVTQPTLFRILDINRPIAEQAALFRAAYKTPFPDSLIAATAKVHGLTLATRNTVDFVACGIQVVNPWRGNME